MCTALASPALLQMSFCRNFSIGGLRRGRDQRPMVRGRSAPLRSRRRVHPPPVRCKLRSRHTAQCYPDGNGWKTVQDKLLIVNNMACRRVLSRRRAVLPCYPRAARSCPRAAVEGRINPAPAHRLQLLHTQPAASSSLAESPTRERGRHLRWHLPVKHPRCLSHPWTCRRMISETAPAPQMAA